MIRQRWWKLLVLVSMLSLCAVTAVGAQSTTYTDPNKLYSFTVPAGWQPAPTPQSTSLPPGTTLGGFFTAPAPLNGNVNVVTVPAPPGGIIDQVATQSRDSVANSLPGYQEAPGGIQNLTLGGQPARRYDYFLTPQGGAKLHGAQVIALQGNAAFVLTFTAAENDFATTIQQAAPILASFKFIGAGGGPPTTLPSTGMPRSLPSYGAAAPLALLAGAALVLGGLTLRRRARTAFAL